MPDAERLLLLERLHAAWQQALRHEQRARATFLDAALEELWASGHHDEAALWRAQVALGDEAQWKAAGYLAGRLDLTGESESESESESEVSDDHQHAD